MACDLVTCEITVRVSEANRLAKVIFRLVEDVLCFVCNLSGSNDIISMSDLFKVTPLT